MPSHANVSINREEVNCVPLSVVRVRVLSRLPAGNRWSTACSTAASASSVRQRCERFQPSISRVQQSSRCWEILLGSGDVLCRRRQLQPAQGGTNIHPCEFAHEMCQQGGGAVFPVATSYPSTHRRGRLQGGEK